MPKKKMPKFKNGQEQKNPLDDTIKAMMEFREKIHLDGLSIQQMKQEGRK